MSIRKSITPDLLISLEYGKQYKSLKRHLSTRVMTPDDYRAKWGLPRDYPMVAAAHSAQRSQLAKALGVSAKADVSLRRSSLSRLPSPPLPKLRLLSGAAAKPPKPSR
ncbi:MAG: MucR family transcriptional regulator [Caulobacteraceae bacterium]